MTSRVEGAAIVEAPAPPNGLALPTVEVDEAWVAVTDIGLGVAPACVGGPKVALPTAFELVSGAELPQAPTLEHDAQDVVCGITVRLGRLDGPLPQGAPEDLRTYSLVVLGRRLDGVPLELRAALHDTVKLVPAPSEGEGFLLEAPSTILAFAVDRWFAGLDLAGAPLTDGVLRIDRKHNPALLAGFRKAFRASARLLRDPDGRGAPNPASVAAPLAVSESGEHRAH